MGDLLSYLVFMDFYCLWHDIRIISSFFYLSLILTFLKGFAIAQLTLCWLWETSVFHLSGLIGRIEKLQIGNKHLPTMKGSDSLTVLSADWSEYVPKLCSVNSAFQNLSISTKYCAVWRTVSCKERLAVHQFFWLASVFLASQSMFLCDD